MLFACITCNLHLVLTMGDMTNTKTTVAYQKYILKEFQFEIERTKENITENMQLKKHTF